MIPTEANPGRREQGSSVAPDTLPRDTRRKRKVRPFHLRLRHAQRKSLAKAAVYLILLLGLLVLWYLMATRQLG